MIRRWIAIVFGPECAYGELAVRSVLTALQEDSPY